MTSEHQTGLNKHLDFVNRIDTSKERKLWGPVASPLSSYDKTFSDLLEDNIDCLFKGKQIVVADLFSYGHALFGLNSKFSLSLALGNTDLSERPNYSHFVGSALDSKVWERIITLLRQKGLTGFNLIMARPCALDESFFPGDFDTVSSYLRKCYSCLVPGGLLLTQLPSRSARFLAKVLDNYPVSNYCLPEYEYQLPIVRIDK